VTIPAQTRRVSPEQHLRFGRAAALAAGASFEDAVALAEAFLWCDLRGWHINGLVRLENTIERLSRGLVQSPAEMKWLQERGVACLLDAGNGLGAVAGGTAMSRAVELAQAHGVGVVGVRRSNHFGAAAYYCARAVEAGCLGFAFSNAFPKVAPHGGANAALGTNPLAFGSPLPNGEMLLVDLSTSAISGADVRRIQKEGRLLPPDVALGPDGRVTLDPAEVDEGCLLPAAGPKGFGLALMVDILSGVLTGGSVGHEVGSLFHTWDRPSDVGHFFIALAIRSFVPMDGFLTGVHRLVAGLRATPLREGFSEIRLPGELRARNAEEFRRTGIPLPVTTVKTLDALAKRLGIRPIGEH